MADDKCSWSADEIETMLDFISQKEGYNILDSRRQQNNDLYKSVSKDMAERSYNKDRKAVLDKVQSPQAQFLKHKRKSVNKSG